VLQESIASRRKFLGGLASHLKTLKKATLPVQTQLNILHTKRSKQDSLAELLPAPLYIFYTELLAHKEVFNEAVELEIVGSGKDALTMAKQLASKEAGNVAYDLVAHNSILQTYFMWIVVGYSFVFQFLTTKITRAI
jgi:THO complex subunit 5